MHDLRPSVAEMTTIVVDTTVINKSTGEILGEYITTPYEAATDPLKPELRKCRSVDDLHEFLEHVDLRILPPLSKFVLLDAQDHAYGQWKRTGIDCRITLPMMNALGTIRDLVKYANIIIMTKAALAKALGVAESNLMKKLAPLISAKLLKVYTSRDGIRKGEIKLLVNPRLIFRGFDNVRDAYIDRWYSDGASEKCSLYERGRRSIAA